MIRHAPMPFATKDGKSVTIKEMEESYIFAGDMKTNPHTGGTGCCTADCVIDPKTATPNPVFEGYHAEVMHRYGQSAILAWYDDTVVGFINFHPVNAAFDDLCPQRNTPELREKLRKFQWPEKADEKLRILCVDVAPGYRRTGLGTKLAETLIQWSPDWGFKRLHVGANENAWWIPCKPFWEKLGFEVVEVIEFDRPRSDGDTKVFVMEREV